MVIIPFSLLANRYNEDCRFYAKELEIITNDCSNSAGWGMRRLGIHFPYCTEGHRTYACHGLFSYSFYGGSYGNDCTSSYLLTWHDSSRTVACSLSRCSTRFGLYYTNLWVALYLRHCFRVHYWHVCSVHPGYVMDNSATKNQSQHIVSCRFGYCWAGTTQPAWLVGVGELLTLCCAIFYAVHIVGLGEWSSKYEPYGFSLLQIATVAVITLVSASPDGITMPPDAWIWGIVGITAVLATAIAFLVQTWAQSLISSTSAAIVMTMEPVFAGLFGVFFGGNRLTLRIILGAVCVLIAMFIVTLKSSSKVTRRES
jgi:hypothetical protein